jgi:hypothetical protein
LLCRLHVALHVLCLLAELGIAAATLAQCVMQRRGVRGSGEASTILFLVLSLVSTAFSFAFNLVGASAVVGWLRRLTRGNPIEHVEPYDPAAELANMAPSLTIAPDVLPGHSSAERSKLTSFGSFWKARRWRRSCIAPVQEHGSLVRDPLDKARGATLVSLDSQQNSLQDAAAVPRPA